MPDILLKELQAENAALKERVAALGIENSHLCVANGELKAQLQYSNAVLDVEKNLQKDVIATLQSKSAALVDACEFVVTNALGQHSIVKLIAALAAFKERGE